MKNFKVFMQSLTMVALIAFSASVMTSCGDDEPEVINGCTDSEGDQYNAEATNDDGSCTFFNKYSGDWAGTFQCQGLLAALFTSADIAIAESVSATNDAVTVIVTSTTLPAPIPLTGTITKDKLTVSQFLPNVEFTGLDIIPNVPGERFDISASGDLSVQADGSLSGTLSFVLDEVAITAIEIPDITDSCVYTATRK